jgi:RNA polymerase sigma factor (sigma-70 family)
VRALGDFDIAEDVVQDAAVIALERWPADGVPDQPEHWLVRVGRRRAIDRWRREGNMKRKIAELEQGADSRAQPVDDRLSLLFTCCHPALSRDAQVALTLRAVAGLDVKQIARAFLCGEATIAQRIVRAKRKIVASGIAFRVPPPERLDERLTEVLAVVYLLYNEAYLSSDGHTADRPDLAEDAEWLAAQLAALMPRQPEVLGLLALIRLHRARRGSRFDSDGSLKPLAVQDRSRWDRTAIDDAIRLIVRASRLRQPGTYQLQAAIVACHAEAPTWEATDWHQVMLLYDELLRLAPTPVARLHRAIALRYVEGPEPALAEIERLTQLRAHHLLHATRAQLLGDLGRHDEARRANELALTLTSNPAERALLESRLA